MDSNAVEKLKTELATIGNRIQSLKATYDATKEPTEKKLLLKELKQLQWQALFYLEKIQNNREV